MADLPGGQPGCKVSKRRRRAAEAAANAGAWLACYSAAASVGLDLGPTQSATNDRKTLLVACSRLMACSACHTLHCIEI